MEPSPSPDDRDYANGEGPHAASEQPTKIMPPASPAGLTPIAATSGHCSACGAALAADQRYCVECGQRRGPLRMPATIGAAQQRLPEAKSGGPRRRGPRMSPNTTLIAAVGTLMLAMGVGVLIGRQANGSNSNKPVQLVTLPGGAGASGTTATEPGGSSTTESTSASKSASTGSSKAKKSVEQVLKGKHLPPKPVVKLGTPGKGPGYQKGHFTGKFFGGAENAKQEEEEELGEEPSNGKK